MNCAYCDTVLKAHGAHEKVGDMLTQDHVIPLSRGGPNHRWNKVPCCKKCNALRQNFCSVREYEHFRSAHGYRRKTTEGPKKRHERTVSILEKVELLMPDAMARWKRELPPLCEHAKKTPTP